MRKLSFLKPAAGSVSMCMSAVLWRETGSSSSSPNVGGRREGGRSHGDGTELEDGMEIKGEITPR